MRFSWLNGKNFKYLSYYPWREAENFHGFVGTSLDASTRGLKNTLASLAREFPAKQIVSARQVHGVAVHEVTRYSALTGEPEADAILIRPGVGNIVAFIKTADCVPILIIAGEERLLIHAGWKGLADGIIKKSCSLLKSPVGAAVLIGPAAGPAYYEVGTDVIDALGEDAVIRGKTEIGYLLSLSETAAKKLHAVLPNANLHDSKVCTMSNTEFHSYRRNKEQSGRNVSFMVS